MPLEINGNTYYRTQEACLLTGISRATLFRWIKSGILGEFVRDRRGWRLFTREDLKKIKSEASRVEADLPLG